MARIASLSVGWSTKQSLLRAVNATVGMAMEKATSPAVGVVFFAGNWDRGTLAKAFSSQLGNIPWVGCSATMAFANRKVLREGMALGLVSAENIRVGIGMAYSNTDRPFDAGSRVVAQALAHLPEPPLGKEEAYHQRAIWLLVDSFEGKGRAIVQGAVREGGTNICWSGVGVGGKGRDSGRMSLLHNGRSILDASVALAMDLPAPLGASAGMSHEPIGPVLCVTKCRDNGNLIEEIDYRPASEVFEAVARTSKVPGMKNATMRDLLENFSLGIPQASGNFILRDVCQCTAKRELQLIAPIHEGCILRLMRTTMKGLVAGARQATREACDQVGGGAGGIIFAECDGRTLRLGRHVYRELDAIIDEAGSGVDVLGCTSYGEVGCLRHGFPQFHNEIIQVVAFPGEHTPSGEV